jgi:membrane fusion protein (multidrug efflux system)
MKTRHVVTVVVTLLFAVLLGGVLWRIRAGDEEGPIGAPSLSSEADSTKAAIRGEAASSAFAGDVAVPVRGGVVRKGTFVQWVQANGQAEPRRSATIRTERVEGPVVSVRVREGDVVPAGSMLARLDTTSYVLDLEQAEADSAKAAADYLNLTLFDDQMKSDSLRRERRRQARIRSGLARAAVQVAKARYKLEHTTLRAPFRGTVAGVAVQEGARVGQGDSVLAVLDLSEVDVEVGVLETDLPHLAPGREATATFSALPGETFHGRLLTVNPVVDRDSRTARVTVRLENPGAHIVPGMSASVRIAGELYAGRTFVPRDAVVERDRRDVVFVFAPDDPGSAMGRAEWKYVHSGLTNDRYVEILPPEPGTNEEMIRPGELVLTEGQETLVHDAKVRLTNADSLRSGGKGTAAAGNGAVSGGGQ